METMCGPHRELVGDEAEAALVREARTGSRSALEGLVRLHQPFVFNVVLRMTADFHEAEDLTQEIFFTLCAKIESFGGKSAFRTWLYRIAVNHVLSSRKFRIERIRESAEDALWDDDERVRAYIERGKAEYADDSPDSALLAEEIRIKCMLGMLLCLSRAQRIVFILSDVFGMKGAMAAEILDMSEAGFRKSLSRARRKLSSFLNGRCGLFDPSRPCRCELTVPANLGSGYVDANRLFFARSDAPRVREIVIANRARLGSLADSRLGELYREHPFLDPPEISRKLAALASSEEFRRIVDAGPSAPVGE
jgi:RNA polymerase sigma factor (sigma-70 family)